jgi:hypothetical protein
MVGVTRMKKVSLLGLTKILVNSITGSRDGVVLRNLSGDTAPRWVQWHFSTAARPQYRVALESLVIPLRIIGSEMKPATFVSAHSASDHQGSEACHVPKLYQVRSDFRSPVELLYLPPDKLKPMVRPA